VDGGGQRWLIWRVERGTEEPPELQDP
jgi:hypothetical protein